MTSEALGILRQLRLTEALDAIRIFPDDPHEFYSAEYDLIAVETEAMPADGDFITGRAPQDAPKGD